jgi:uncharacterized membrane protein
MLLNFYHKKIIDLKMIGKKLFVRLLPRKNLDEVEKDFYDILKNIRKKSPEKYRNGDFFDLKRASNSWKVRSYLKTSFPALQKKVKKIGKHYVETTGLTILSVIMFVLIYFAYFLRIFGLIFLVVAIFLFLLKMTLSQSALFTRHKHEYYKEYQHWQAFRRWLSYSPSMKSSSHDAVRLWDHYLVYATALGVSRKVLKQLKLQGIISESRYNVYMGINTTSVSFSMSSGISRSGGVGGAGGGGVGGGGGGGR